MSLIDIFTDSQDYSRRSIRLLRLQLNKELEWKQSTSAVNRCCVSSVQSLFWSLLCSSVALSLHSLVLLLEMSRKAGCFPVTSLFQYVFPSGEIKSTVWTRQDSPGARGQDTHFEGGQGFFLFLLYIKLPFPLVYALVCIGVLMYSINASCIIIASFMSPV